MSTSSDVKSTWLLGVIFADAAAQAFELRPGVRVKQEILILMIRAQERSVSSEIEREKGDSKNAGALLRFWECESE